MARARLALLALLFALSAPSPALADTPLETVPAAQGYKGKSTTVSTKGADISTADFVGAIMDGDRYPMTAEYAGVKALFDCKTLEKRADGSVVVYQRTGGNFMVSSRHYVILLKVVKQTDSYAEIQWDLVKHTQSGDTWSGPFASALNKNPDAVYTPYNRGGWKYDKAAGTITYWVTSDPGGNIPDFMQTQGAVTAFPLELLKTRWGVVP